MNFLSSRADRTLSDADEKSLWKVDLVLGCLPAGDPVVVHCHAGLHCIGFFIYVLLRRHGLTSQKAFEALMTTRRSTYEEMTWRKGHRPTLVDKAETAFNALFGALA